MKPLPALLASLSLALAFGGVQAQTDPHQHAGPPAADAATPHAAPVAAPVAAPAGMMDCAAMMHGDGSMMHGNGAMMHGQGASPGMGGAMPANHPSMKMHGPMMCGQGMQMPMSGDVDKDFAAMMVMHHQQAVRMADIQIAEGKNPELKAMAKKMRAAQLAEIAQLEKYR